MLIERGRDIAAIEIESGLTVASDAFRARDLWRNDATERGRFGAIFPALVYGGDERCTREGVA